MRAGIFLLAAAALPLRAVLPRDLDFSRQDAQAQRIVSPALAHFRTPALTNFPPVWGPDLEGQRRVAMGNDVKGGIWKDCG